MTLATGEGRRGGVLRYVPYAGSRILSDALVHAQDSRLAVALSKAGA